MSAGAIGGAVAAIVSNNLTGGGSLRKKKEEAIAAKCIFCGKQIDSRHYFKQNEKFWCCKECFLEWEAKQYI